MRGAAGGIDGDVGPAVHHADDRILLQIGFDPLRFEVDPQTVRDIPVDIEGKILRLGIGGAPKPQGFKRNAPAPARVGEGIADPLAQDTALKDAVFVEFPGAARRRHREQRVIIDQCERGKLLGEEAGFGAQPFKGDEQIAIGGFILNNRRPCLAVTFQIGGAHARPLGHNHGARRREIGFVKIGAFKEPVAPDRAHAEAAAVQRRSAIARIGNLRCVGAADQFRIGVTKLHTDRPCVAFKRCRTDQRETR